VIGCPDQNSDDDTALTLTASSLTCVKNASTSVIDTVTVEFTGTDIVTAPMATRYYNRYIFSFLHSTIIL
jgi:hypothetical protein